MTKKTIILLALFISLTFKSYGNSQIGADIGWKYVGNDSLKILVSYYSTFRKVDTSFYSKTFIETSCEKKRVYLKFDSQETLMNCAYNTWYKYQLRVYYFSKTIDIKTYKANACCDLNVFVQKSTRFNSSHVTRGDFYLDSRINICDTLQKDLVWRRPAITTSMSRYQYVWDNGAISNFGNLKYTLEDSKSSATTKATWKRNFNYDKPLVFSKFPNKNLAFPAGFHLDSLNGMLQFIPNQANKSTLLGIRASIGIKEYGSRNYELRITSSSAPSVNYEGNPRISGVNGSSYENQENFNAKVCSNSSNQFFIVVSDSFKNNRILSDIKTNISGLKVEHTDKNSIIDTITFKFTIDSSATKSEYYISVKAQNDSCYFFGKRSVVITIRVDSLLGSGYIEKSQINCNKYKFKVKTKDHVVSNYQWYSNSKPIKLSSIAVQKTFNSPGRYIIQSKLNGCQISIPEDTVIISHLNNLKISGLKDSFFCGLDTVEISPKVSNDSKPYFSAWQTTNTNLNIIDSSANTLRAFIKQQATEVYGLKLTVRDSAQCFRSKRISLRALYGELNKSMVDTIICTNDSVIYLLNGYDPNGLWNTDLNINGNKLLIGPADTGKQEISYRLISANSCKQAFINLELSNLPKIVFSQSDISTCISNDSIELSAKPYGGIWSGIGVNKSFFNQKLAREGTHFPVYTFEKSNGCRSSDSIEIKVYNTKPKAESPDLVAYCKNQGEITIKAEPITGVWLEDNLGSLPNELVLNTNKFNVGEHELIFYNLDKNQCFNTDTTILQILETPSVKYFQSDTLISLNDSIQFSIHHNKDFDQVHNWAIALEKDTAHFSKDADFYFVPKNIGSYNVHYHSIFATNGCRRQKADTNAFKVILPIGVNNGIKVEPTIFPNPTSRRFTIEGISVFKDVNLYSVTGKNTAIEISIGENSVEVELLEKVTAGIYVLKIETENAIYNRPLIIE